MYAGTIVEDGMTKRFMSALLAAVAILPGVATAQDGQRGWRGDGQRAERPQGNGRQQGDARPQRPQVSDQQRAERRAERQAQRAQQGNDGPRRDWQRPGGDWQRPGGNQPQRFADRNGDGRPDRGGFDRGNRPEDRAGFRRDNGRPNWDRPNWNRNDNRYAQRWGNGNYNRWNNGWRQDRRYDWNGYRSYNRNAFRLPRYYAPSGWGYGYRRFGIGVRLAAPLWGQNYWISDPWAYRLPPAYGPYRWVRYYNDAILVDMRTGYTVDVINDIFW